jgi:hypothetical protein
VSDAELKELTDFLLQLLKERSPLTPADLMAAAPGAPATFSPASLTRAVWRLVETGEAKFTSDWKLTLAA